MKNPLGIVSFPADLANAIRLLPRIARRLDEIAEHTGSMSRDTTCLPSLDRRMQTVAEATDVLPPMDDRMATIEQAMPVLVEVQQQLAQLPQTIDALSVQVAELAALMDRLVPSLEPLGRLAGRVPGGRRHATTEQRDG